jgi:uncharacterized protein (TIGR02301 family)
MSARRLSRRSNGRPAALITGLIAALMLAATVPMPASAQDGRFERIVELAEVLGEAQAVRAACNGDRDQTWREYMIRMIEQEAPTGPRKSTLTSAFNRGFRTQSSRTSACTSDMVQIEAAIASRGRALADAVAASYLE